MKALAVWVAALVLVPAAAASTPLGDLAVHDLRLAGERERQGAAHVPTRGRARPQRARLGRDQRAAAVERGAAGRVPVRLLGRAAQPRPLRGTAVRRPLRAVRRAAARRSSSTACKAPDGTYWAVQAWQRLLPMRGFAPWLPDQGKLEFHVSHWSGPLAQFEVSQNWTYGGRWQGLFGRLTYRGSTGLRLQDAVRDEARRRLCALRLHRRARLGLRRRLAPRRREGAAPRKRRVLLQLRPAGAAARVSGPRARAAPRSAMLTA